MSEDKSWAVQWLQSRHPTQEQTAVITMATETLDTIQDKHDERRSELDEKLEKRLDYLRTADFSKVSPDLVKQAEAREKEITSAQSSHDKAIARLDQRSGSVQDVQRIIVRR